MERDYKKESEWRKKKYTRLVADVDKELAESFKEKLKNKGIKYSDWLKERIDEYMQ